MKKSLLSVTIASLVPMAMLGDVTITFPNGQNDAKYEMQHLLISDAAKARAERPAPATDSIAVVNGTAKFQVEPAGAAQYVIPIGDRKVIKFYTEPNSELTINIVSTDPLEYIVSGSELMDGITTIDKEIAATRNKISAAAKSEPRDDKAIEAAINELTNYLTDYIKANPANPASVYAALNIDDEELFLTTFESLPESLKTSTLYPILVSQQSYVMKRVEADKKRQELASGKYDAPDFTLKNLDGKDVKLSDFKGKWVILDFWGSWCPWCIKGFPKLKEAYAKYNSKLEIIGVDCRDKEEIWRKAVAKYELPWVNLYNPESSTILAEYLVQAFPTKAIINPEGKIVNITVGENPAFFDELEKLINAK